jgi:hypothetical protein
MRISKLPDKGLLIGMAVLAVAFAFVLALSSASQASASPDTTDSSSPPAASLPSQSISSGVQAIAVQPGQMVSYDQVEQYALTHGLTGRVTKQPAQRMIRVIQLLPNDQIEKLLDGEETGFPSTKLLWLVKLQGSFTFAGPQGSSMTAPFGVLIIDPATGNLIMEGGLDQ